VTTAVDSLAPAVVERPPARASVANRILALGAALAAVISAAISPAAHRVSGSGRAGMIAIWSAAAVVVATRRPHERLGRLLAAGAALGAIAAFAAAAGARSAGGTDAVAALVVAGAVAMLPWVGMQVLLGLPDGACRTRRALIITGYAAGALVALSIWTQRPNLPLWPVALEAAVAATIGLAVSHRHYQKAQGAERRRMQWFGCAVAVGVEVSLISLAGRLLVDWPSNGYAVLAVATVALPIALVVASTTRAVGRVDVILARTVSLAAVTAVVVAVFVVVVIGLGRTPNDHDRGVLGLSMVAAGVSALLYLPAREHLVRFANRLAYGEREPPDQALRTFGSRLSRAIPLDELLLQVAESLRKSMGLARAEVWTGADGRLERAVSVPDAGPAVVTLSHDEEAVVARAGTSGPAWTRIWLPALLEGRHDAGLRVAPVVHSGRLLGLILAVRASQGDPFREEDELILAELARQVGLALHNVHLDSALEATLDEVRRQAHELQASRARIVAASDAARRQIERDLHDGAQQHLVSLAVNLRIARQLAEADPPAAQAMLEQLGHDLQDAVQQLRDLAHGIYPPLLMDRGLAEALSAAAGRAAIPTDVDASGIARYTPEIEAAVYFCCLEALQNAGKHAGAGARATVRVWQEEGALLFEVADDGAGFDPAARSGLGAGFVNMADRVGAIGGRLAVDAALGRGVKVSGRVPLS
jgi:signal transduction histidine kinase